MTNREDVLSDFTIEPEMSPAVLKTYLSKYPEFADNLLDLFHELTMIDMEAVCANFGRGVPSIDERIIERCEDTAANAIEYLTGGKDE